MSDDRRRIIIIVDDEANVPVDPTAAQPLLRLQSTGLKVQVEFSVPRGMSNEQAGKRVQWVLERVQQALAE